MSGDNVTRLNRSTDKAGVIETFNAEIVPNCNEIFVVGADANGALRWDAFGMRRADLLWAIEKFKHDLLFGGGE